ncbi:unnamed protein product [Pedinophyceae sp. YPF-701]|nr:unnamed protein product [Pedinophyceae sp. YPF-701]
MLDSWHDNDAVEVTVHAFASTFRLAQDPASKHLGKSVWDASIQLAKWLERHQRKGELCRHKVEGKRAIEVGAGMGLGGMALAMLGADVVLTDVEDVLPLLRRNVAVNLQAGEHAGVLAGRDPQWSGKVGQAEVARLDWTTWQQDIPPLSPPFDIVLAADCVYHEDLVVDLFHTVEALCGPRSVFVSSQEFRSQAVHDAFMAAFARGFSIRKVPASKMDPEHSHPSIEVYVMKPLRGRRGRGRSGSGREAGGEGGSVAEEDQGSEPAGSRGEGPT